MSLKVIISEDNKNKRRKKYIRYSLFLFIIISFIIGFVLIKNKIYDRSTDSLAAVSPEEDRNINKFYDTFEIPEIGQEASLFRLSDIETKVQFDLREKRDGWVLVVFQVIGHPPCVAIETELKELEDNNSHDLEIITVGREIDKKRIVEYKKEYEIQRKWLLDEKGLVSAGYRVETFPAWFLLDKDNVIRFIDTGYVKAEVIEKYIRD